MEELKQAFFFLPLIAAGIGAAIGGAKGGWKGALTGAGLGFGTSFIPGIAGFAAGTSAGYNPATFGAAADLGVKATGGSLLKNIATGAGLANTGLDIASKLRPGPYIPPQYPPVQQPAIVGASSGPRLGSMQNALQLLQQLRSRSTI